MAEELGDEDRVTIEKSPDGKTIVVHDFTNKKPFDQKLMDEITALLSSGTFDDKMLALEKIEQSESSFPAGYIFKIFDKLKTDSDERVSTQAKKVYNKLYGRYIRAMKETFVDFSDSVKNTSSAFKASQKAASLLVTVIDTPIKNIDLKKLDGYFRSIRKIGSHTPWAVPRISASPTFWADYYLDPVIHPKNSDLTLAEALGRDPKLVAEELKKISKADKDIIFNYEAYPLIFKLERGLRELIKERICGKYSTTITQKIPSDIIEEWNKRRQTERENPYAEGEYDLIDYSDFNDLKTIIEKKSNKKDFADKLNDQQLAGLISKLNELDPIRKKIAHSRPLTTKEFNRLKLYADDIEKLLK